MARRHAIEPEPPGFIAVPAVDFEFGSGFFLRSGADQLHQGAGDGLVRRGVDRHTLHGLGVRGHRQQQKAADHGSLAFAASISAAVTGVSVTVSCPLARTVTVTARLSKSLRNSPYCTRP